MSTKFVGDRDFTVKCAGLPCVGDEVKFSRPLFHGFPSKVFLGWETLSGVIVASSFGEKTNRHTFTLLTNDGKRSVRSTTFLKNGCWRKPWSDETERWVQLKEQRVQSLKTCARFFDEQMQPA